MGVPVHLFSVLHRFKPSFTTWQVDVPSTALLLFCHLAHSLAGSCSTTAAPSCCDNINNSKDWISERYFIGIDLCSFWLVDIQRQLHLKNHTREKKQVTFKSSVGALCVFHIWTSVKSRKEWASFLTLPELANSTPSIYRQWVSTLQ